MDAVLGPGVTGLRNGIAVTASPAWTGRPVRGRRPVPRWIFLAQDSGLEVTEVRAGLDRELGHQDRPQLLVGAQRVALAAGPVQREHPLEPEPLA